MSNPIADRPGAVLVGVQLPEVSDVEHATHLAELRRLVHTLGYETVATLSQRRAGSGSGTVLGTGKLKELANLTGGPGVIASGAADRTSKAKERWEAEAADDEDAADEEAAGRRAAGRGRGEAHGGGGRPRALAEPAAQPRERDRRGGARPHRRDRRDLPPPRAAAARRACRSRSRGSTTSRRGCARPAGRARARGTGAGARASPRSSSIAARSATASPSCATELAAIQRRVEDRGATPQGSAAGRARRLHQRRQVVADARAHRQRGASRRQAVRDARHHRARAAARDPAAHPRLRHGRLHQEAAARSRRLASARRSTRRSRPRCCCTSSTPPTRPARPSSRSRATCCARSARPTVPSLLLLNKIDRSTRPRGAP